MVYGLRQCFRQSLLISRDTDDMNRAKFACCIFKNTAAEATQKHPDSLHIGFWIKRCLLHIQKPFPVAHFLSTPYPVTWPHLELPPTAQWLHSRFCMYHLYSPVTVIKDSSLCLCSCSHPPPSFSPLFVEVIRQNPWICSAVRSRKYRRLIETLKT